jgi:sugar phosphate isomerase/epimerase
MDSDNPDRPMPPLPLACGTTFLFRDPDQALDVRYPERERILNHIAWSAREGFAGIELGSTTFEHFNRTYQPDFTKAVRLSLSDMSMKIAQLKANFLVQLAVGNSRATALNHLDFVFERAAEMSCGVVAVPGSLIPGAPTAHGFLFPGGPPSRIQIPEEFSWSALWERYVEVIASIVDQAKKHRLKVALEPRPREIIATTDGLLILLREIGSTGLGALIDTAYLFAQREYIPLSIRKLENSIFGVYLSDSDGLLEHHWTPGEGKIDWAEVIQSLRAVGYGGLHTLDVGIVGNPEFDFRQGKSFLERLMLTMQ